MKVQIYFSLHLFLLFCIPVHSYKNITDEDIYRSMYVQQKFCGDYLANTMRELCIQYNGPRARRGIIECCKTSCSYYYLMKYFCKIPRIDVDDLGQPGTGEGKTNIESMSRSKGEQQPQQVIRNSENINSRQGPLLNKIHRQPKKEEVKHKPAEYGYVSSTRPPIIYSHSNTIARGVMIYHIPMQNNNQK